MLFLFQPAEENEAGGMLMYEDGLWRLATAPLWPPRPAQVVVILRLTQQFFFNLEVLGYFQGEGGHAAFPHEATDALCSSFLLYYSQTIVVVMLTLIQGWGRLPLVLPCRNY